MHDKHPHAHPAPEPVRRPVAWVTWGIVATTFAVFLAQLVDLHRTGNDILGDKLAFSPEAWAEHRYWTLLTYAWAHSVNMFGYPSLFWVHIVSNMLPLVALGPALEEILGHLRYLGLYVAGAIAAALAWYVSISWWGGPVDAEEGIIGASGAVFAVIAAIGTAAPDIRVIFILFYFLPVRMTSRLHTSISWVALLICALEVAQAVFHWWPEIAHSAHLGGAAFGFLYVLMLRRRVRRDERPNSQ